MLLTLSAKQLRIDLAQLVVGRAEFGTQQGDQNGQRPSELSALRPGQRIQLSK
jgi:hypothetical protein